MKKNGFGMTGEWVNDDIILIFRVNYAFNIIIVSRFHLFLDALKAIFNNMFYGFCNIESLQKIIKMAKS